MVLAETLIYFFIFIMGSGALYLSLKKEKAVAYPVLAFGFYLVAVFYGASIPFATSSSGEVVGTSANAVLSGLAFLFMLFAFFRLIYTIFSIFRG